MESIRLDEQAFYNIIESCVLRLIDEATENHIFYEYMEDYGVPYVLDEFAKNPKGKQNWYPLIDPNMYYKALQEFTQYGKLIRFPEKHVYQWMGIIMRNTATLVANTELSGHSSHFPIDECQDFLESWFNDNRYICVDTYDNVVLELNSDEAWNICNGRNLHEAVDKHGQEYFPFVDQETVNQISKNEEIEDFKNNNLDLINLIDKYNNKEFNRGKIEIDYKNKRFLLSCDVFSLLDDIGLYDWMMMPDGSDAWSDFGIDPLYEIIDEYNSELPPEKVLVIVNRCLDVYHQRGDLSSIFIRGGKNSLNRISESIKKKGYVI